jgi:hypothetical protein
MANDEISDVGAVFNRDCPGKSRLKAAPTNL